MVTKLRLQHFRSYRDATFTFAPGLTAVVGLNGSGKTNLLEAVLVLGRGTSYRAKDTELVHHEHEWARLDGEMSGVERTVKLLPEGKQFIIENKQQSRLSVNSIQPIVLFEPNHLFLLHGPPAQRRNFLDILLEQTVSGFTTTTRHFKRVLGHRNALLKAKPADLHQQLFVWNIRISELGGKIARERIGLIDDYNQQISELYSILAGKSSHIELRYNSSQPLDNYETALLRQLETTISQDLARGYTVHGPHHDDFTIFINGRPAETSASRGETRTLVLALKLAELQLLRTARTTTPILLLDDVFSELDHSRQTLLTRSIQDVQTIITTTDITPGSLPAAAKTIVVRRDQEPRR